MPSKTEKSRRRAIVLGIQQTERTAQEAAMPLSKSDLKALLETLEMGLFEQRVDGTTWCFCDHTLKHTRTFLQTRRLPEEDVVVWLNEYGGFCDCEIAANVGGVWVDRLSD